MSAPAVRTATLTYLRTKFPTKKIVDLSGRFEMLQTYLKSQSIGLEEEWVGIQFEGDIDEPQALATSNERGFWVENGMIFVHCVSPASSTSPNSTVTTAHDFRKALRSYRLLPKCYIETVTPPNTESGTAFLFESGFMSATVAAFYRYEMNEND